MGRIENEARLGEAGSGIRLPSRGSAPPVRMKKAGCVESQKRSQGSGPRVSMMKAGDGSTRKKRSQVRRVFVPSYFIVYVVFVCNQASYCVNSEKHVALSRNSKATKRAWIS